MKTAVEWLVEKYVNNGFIITVEVLQQAKEMENERVTEAYRIGRIGKSIKEFNETFKSENVVMFMNTENSGIESIKLTDNPDCGVKGITFKSE